MFADVHLGQSKSADRILILSVWSHGQSARQLEQVEKPKLVDEAMALIRKSFGPATLDPEQALVTSWNTDEFSRGAYVNLPVGATFDDLDALGTPVADRLFFAGEATAPASGNRAWSVAFGSARGRGRLRRWCGSSGTQGRSPWA